jgi:dihydrofolate reductase
MRLSLIAAVARNGVIGAKQGIPWRLSTDLQRFKKLTMGKPVIMGRKTFESIGKPLPGRLNIVITRGSRLAADVVCVADIDEAIKAAAGSGAEEAMIIGGGEIYAATIDRANALYITHVDAAPEGDTFFPAIDQSIWTDVSTAALPAGDKDSAATRYVVYHRREAKPGN